METTQNLAEWQEAFRMATVPVEAHGVKGMKSTPWRKTFKSTNALLKWAEKNDATVYGTRDLEAASEGRLSA